MRRLIAVAVILAFTASSIEADAKPRGCFTKSEEAAEQMVRYGLRLREGGRACEESPWSVPTLALWEDVDKQFGPQFKQQTDIRAKAFEREFENDAEHRLAMWNARIVFYYRHYPLSDIYCLGIKSSLEDMQKKGWNSFVKLSRFATDEIRMTYEPCDK